MALWKGRWVKFQECCIENAKSVKMDCSIVSQVTKFILRAALKACT